MTLLLLRRYIAEPRLLSIMGMMSMMFIFSGDLGIVLLWVAALSAFINVPMRATIFEAALPIKARTLVQARMLASTMTAAIPLVAWLASLQFSKMAHLSEILLTDMVGVRPLTYVDRLSFCAITILMAILPLMIRAGSMQSPPKLLVVSALVATAVIAVASIFTLPPPVALTILTLCVVGASIATLWKTPEAPQLAMLTLENDRRSSSKTAVDSAGGRFWYLTVARSLISPQWLMFFPLLVLMSGSSMWLPYIGIILSSLTLVRKKSAWLGAFPLSRRATLMLGFVPAMLGTFGAVVLGQFVHLPVMDTSKMNPVTWDSPYNPYEKGKYFNSETRIKLMYWEVAQDGQVPRITSPTGESVMPYTMPILGFTFYNPYSSNEKSSKDFVKWQYSRASTRVYGYPVPLPQSYEEGLVHPRPLYESPRVRILFASALLCFIMLTYVTAELSSLPAIAGKLGLQYAAAAFVVLPGLLAIALDWVYGSGSSVTLPLVKRQLLHLSEVLPSNIGAVFVIALLPALAIYALIEWQARHLENVPVVVVKQP